MQRIFYLIRTLAKIYWSKLDDRLKRKILNTWIQVFFLNRFDSKNRRANIVGFDVKFLDFFLLSYLYKELFIDNDYYFAAENTNPYIIDCGSNIGMSILYFKTLYPQSRIVGFEPGEKAFLCLKENIKNNGLHSVNIHPVALSDMEGFTDFYYDPENPGSLYMSTIPERFPKHSQKVETSLLSKYVSEEIDFLKIDIEGAEMAVLQELCSAGKINLIKQMVIEYHHHITEETDDFSKILILLEKAGFGYQIESRLERPLRGGQFQDILVYAYRKKLVS